MAITHSQAKPNAYSDRAIRYNLFLPMLFRAKKGFPLLSLLQFIWISAGIEVANNSPITDKFNLGVIQV